MDDDAGYGRDPANGMLIGPDGCHYSSLHGLYHSALLGLCGCGSPEEAYNFCRDILKTCDRRDKAKDWISAENAAAEIIKAQPEMAAHVFMHMLTHLDLLEHGGSVGGSWLTPDGEKIVDLRAANEGEFDD